MEYRELINKSAGKPNDYYEQQIAHIKYMNDGTITPMKGEDGTIIPNVAWADNSAYDYMKPTIEDEMYGGAEWYKNQQNLYNHNYLKY